MEGFNLVARLFQELRQNLKAWRDHEIDYIVYTYKQECIWSEIRKHGPHIELAIVLTILAAKKSSDRRIFFVGIPPAHARIAVDLTDKTAANIAARLVEEWSTDP